MADIAVVFHWTPDIMRDMDVDELVEWHRLATDRLRVLTRW